MFRRGRIAVQSDGVAPHSLDPVEYEVFLSSLFPVSVSSLAMDMICRWSDLIFKTDLITRIRWAQLHPVTTGTLAHWNSTYDANSDWLVARGSLQHGCGAQAFLGRSFFHSSPISIDVRSFEILRC